MVLEGAMISIAVLALTISHPGLVWNVEWNQLSKNMKIVSDKDEEVPALMSQSEGSYVEMK